MTRLRKWLLTLAAMGLFLLLWQRFSWYVLWPLPPMDTMVSTTADG